MKHQAPPNAFVVISRVAEGTYTVTYGSREDPAARYCCDGFRDIHEAIAWVDRLDQAWANISARTRAAAPQRVSLEARPQRLRDSILRNRQGSLVPALLSVRRAGT